MLNELIAFCGVDCSACSDLTSGKCPGCRKTEWPEGDACMPVECCGKRGISCCGECAGFPCPDMAEFYKESESHERAFELMRSIKNE